MKRARSHADLKRSRRTVDRIQRLSDRVVGLGPFGIGLDGVLAAIPGVGAAYSFGAGGLLIWHALRVRASPATIAKMGVVLALDTVVAAPSGPLSALADTLFTGHRWAARVLASHMDETIYIEGDREEAQARPEVAELLAKARSGEERRRIVFLGR